MYQSYVWTAYGIFTTVMVTTVCYYWWQYRAEKNKSKRGRV